jgi:hypothetical protein
MDNIKTKIPTGLKVFFSISIVTNTLPMLVFYIAKYLDLYLSKNFSYFLSSISLNFGKISQSKIQYAENSSMLFMPIIISFVVIFVYLLFMTDKLKLEKFRKKIFFKIIKWFSVFNLLILVLKIGSGSLGLTTSGWNSVISVVIVLVVSISFLLYIFISKELKSFFKINL